MYTKNRASKIKIFLRVGRERTGLLRENIRYEQFLFMLKTCREYISFACITHCHILFILVHFVQY